MQQDADARRGKALLAGALCLLAVLLLRNAWVCDDAFITLRTVDNFVHGRGLRWNVAERVQTYTHPLWMLLLSAASFCTREFFITTMVVSTAVSLAAMGTFAFRVARTPAAGLLALLAFVMSRSFHDYCGSGLENPLTYLLLALQMAAWLRPERDARRLLHLSLIAGLGMANRLDTALLFLPAPAMALFATKAPWLRRIAAGAIGALPILAWEVFSLVYYGFAFPNTAYAKLNTQIAQAELLRQGFMYYVDVLHRDPLTPALIAAGLAFGLRRGRRELIPFVLGVALYLLYILKIGGDFMSGRFFTAPFLIAAAQFARVDFALRDIRTAGAAAFVSVLGFCAAFPTLSLQADVEPPLERKWNENGIADERFFYFKFSNLAAMKRMNFHPDIDYVPMRTLNAFAPIVYPENIIGNFGFHCRPDVHLIDDMALADPLLARLPAREKEDWRIGHFHRLVPIGYHDTLATGEDRFEDRDLAEYWRRLCVVTRGPVLSGERFAEIVRFARGGNDHLIDAESYRDPTPELAGKAWREELLAWRIRLSQISTPKHAWLPTGTTGQPFTRKIGNGIRIDMEGVRSAPAVEINASANHMFRIDFFRDGEKLGSAEVPSADTSWIHTAIRRIDVPAEAVEAGYDRVVIEMIHGESPAYLAHFRMMP